MSTSGLTEEEIFKMQQWAERFQTVRLKKAGDVITAKKYGVIDGEEQEYYIDYHVIADQGTDLPDDGDYPLNKFEVVYKAATVHPHEYQSEEEMSDAKDVLRFVG